MRRRSPVWLRALTALWGLWLTAALTEAPGVHTCRVHGGHAAHAGHAAPMSAAGHAMHTMASQSPAPGDEHDGTAPACSCLGLCCCAAAIAAPSESPALAVNVAYAPVSVPRTAATTLRLDRPHSRPFANGPPAI